MHACVCMRVRACMRACVSVCACASVCVHVCVSACMRACMSVCACVLEHACNHNQMHSMVRCFSQHLKKKTIKKTSKKKKKTKTKTEGWLKHHLLLLSSLSGLLLFVLLLLWLCRSCAFLAAVEYGAIPCVLSQLSLFRQHWNRHTYVTGQTQIQENCRFYQDKLQLDFFLGQTQILGFPARVRLCF